LRLMASTVSTCAPLLLGLIANPAAVAAYLLGDRLKALVASAYQPFVQGLYLMRCREGGNSMRRSLVAALCLMMAVLILTCALTAWQSDWINVHLYRSKYPDTGLLALFTLAGHISVISSLGYFLVLIPRGRTGLFIGAVSGQVVVFVASLLLLTRSNPFGGPAIAALSAEGFLLVAIGSLLLTIVQQPKPVLAGRP
jgi:hypothetical protein